MQAGTLTCHLLPHRAMMIWRSALSKHYESHPADCLPTATMISLWYCCSLCSYLLFTYRDVGTGMSVDTPKIMKGYEGVSLTPKNEYKMSIFSLQYEKYFQTIDLLWYSFNCTNFGKLILRKIIKIAATRCHILKLKCTNSILAGALPQTLLGELRVLPQTS